MFCYSLVMLAFISNVIINKTMQRHIWVKSSDITQPWQSTCLFGVCQFHILQLVNKYTCTLSIRGSQSSICIYEATLRNFLGSSVGQFSLNGALKGEAQSLSSTMEGSHCGTITNCGDLKRRAPFRKRCKRGCKTVVCPATPHDASQLQQCIPSW